MSALSKVFITIFSLGILFSASAQMSKDDQKEWKKRLKDLSPEQYKNLVDENKTLKGQVASLRTEKAGVDRIIQDKDDQIIQYQAQIGEMRKQVEEARAEASRNQVAKPVAQQQQPRARAVETSNDDNIGVIFKVQIGAFKNKDLSKFYGAGKNFSGETSEDGIMSYSLGSFRDYWEADAFKKYLREMGVKDAWIVSFKDGKRVPIKDVLESVTKS